MKNLPRFLSPCPLYIIFIAFCLIGLSCSDDNREFLDIEESVRENESLAAGSESWEKTFERIWTDQTILVPHGSSIQEAVNAAKPGDAILIEPGIYTEEINIDKDDIKLIGMPGMSGQTVEVPHGITGNIDHAQIINIKPAHQGNFPFQSLDRLKNLNGSNNSLRLARESLPDGIVHYTFNLRVGGQKHNVIRLHRVVRELRPGITAATEGAVFMIHGASQDFEDIFLYPGTDVATPETSCPAYLASHNLDVWGIDLGWTTLSASTEDFSFMKQWGVDRDVNHTLRAVSAARLIRLLTGTGFGQMNLLGFSYGATLAYAAAGKESQKHRVVRHIKGIIPVDQPMKFGPEDEPSRIFACNGAAQNLQLLEAGMYQDPGGQGAAGIGFLAISDPEGESPVIPGFSNYQAGLFIGTNTYLQRNIPNNFWHFVGGDMSQPTDLPNDLKYTESQRWFGLLLGLPPYQPVRTTFDVLTCLCNEVDVSFDDYLDQITVPIFYLGAAGGTGYQGEYSLTLTSSDDVTSHIVTLEPEERRFVDFGHADLFLASEASTLVWEPLRQWLVAHN